jgi:hypothetical protein
MTLYRNTPAHKENSGAGIRGKGWYATKVGLQVFDYRIAGKQKTGFDHGMPNVTATPHGGRSIHTMVSV